jgi:hypothetical protein
MVGSSTKSKLRGIAFCAAALIAAPRVAAAADVDAQPAAAPDSIEAVVERLSQLEASDASQIKAQAQLIAQQADELARTRALLDKQQRELDAARLTSADNEAIRAGSRVMGAPPADDTQIAEIRAGASDAGTPPPSGPVGEAPPPVPAATLALPQGIDVLTPKGQLIFDNALEYQNSASDRLVFAGIQIVSGVELGLLEANQTRNDSGILLDTLRYGITNRLEVEATVPWVTRSDRVTLVETADTTLSRTETINGSGLGDVEGTLRYQITSGLNGSPIIVAAMRVISDSGTGPFNVLYDKQGVAQRLPTGSGFWAVDPNITMIYPLDPIVLFGAVGYQHSFGEDINKTFGSDLGAVRVGHVQPGDSISAAIGFAFSLNPHFSYSLGYRENYFFPTSTVFLPTQLSVTGSKQESLPLNAGALLVGGSYQINRHVSLNLNFEFGVTPDAPNDTIIFRIPYAF